MPPDLGVGAPPRGCAEKQQKKGYANELVQIRKEHNDAMYELDIRMEKNRSMHREQLQKRLAAKKSNKKKKVKMTRPARHTWKIYSKERDIL